MTARPGPAPRSCAGLAPAAAMAALVALGGCRGDPGRPLGPADSFVLLAPQAGGAVSPGGLPVVRRLDLAAEEARPLAKLFADGFAAEVLRTAYLAKQLVRESRDPQGQPRSTPQGRARAADAVAVVVGLDRQPHARGLAVDRFLGGPEEKPDVVWIGLPADLERDKALVQTLAGRLGTYTLHLALTGGSFSDPAAVLPPSLDAGYRMTMEVIAREWRAGRGPQDVVPHDAGTAAQRALFADIRENRAVLAGTGLALAPRPPVELLAEPRVAATVLYRMAQSRTIAQRVAPEGFYARFTAGPLPPGVSPASVLGPFRNFQAKLLGSWSDAVARGKPPRDIAQLVEVYAAAFPAEKVEALRIFVVTTFGKTIRPGGVSTRAQDAARALADIDALVAEVVAGRQSLRAAVAAGGP